MGNDGPAAPTLTQIGEMSLRYLEILGETPQLSELTLSQLRIIAHVGQAEMNGEPLGLTELAERLDAPISSVSGAVNVLGGFTGRPKLLALEAHSRDRRRRILRVAKEGREMRSKNLRRIRRAFGNVLGQKW